MAAVSPINIEPADFTHAGLFVGAHLEVAAKPPTSAVPASVAGSPVDVAAAGAATAIRAKIGAMQGELAPKGPDMQAKAAASAAALQAQDTQNASPLKDLASAIPSTGSNGGGINAPSTNSAARHGDNGRVQMVGHGFKTDAPPNQSAAPNESGTAVHRQAPTTMRSAPPTAMGPGYDPSKHNPTPGELEEDAGKVAAGIGGDLLLPESAGIKGPMSIGEDLLNGKKPSPGNGLGVAVSGFGGFETVKDGLKDAMHTNPPAMRPDFIDDFLHDRTHFWEDGTGQPTR
jgi:hypothetical protein